MVQRFSRFAGCVSSLQPNNWPHQVLFARATGLRRAELRDLRIREVYTNECGHLVVYVKNGKGGKSREVPVLPEYEHEVRAVIEGREPEEHVFDHIPTAMDVQSYRRGSHKHAINTMPHSDHYRLREEGSSQRIMMMPLQKRCQKRLVTGAKVSF